MAQTKGMNFGVLIALGAGIGSAVGVALGQIAIGVAIGAGVGVAMWAVFNARKGTVESQDDSSPDPD